MIFIQLWTQFLSQTAPSFNGSLLFVYLQMGVSAILPIFTLFHIVKRENKWESALLCMVPAILIASIAIVEPLFFGSFLGDGFTDVIRLRNFLDQAAFYQEAFVLCGIFLLLAGLYLFLEFKNGRLSILTILLNAGLETIFAVIVLFVGIDYFLAEGHLLQAFSDTILKWYVYGLYLLLNKSCFFLLCLIWFLLFRERQENTEPDYLFHYEGWLRHYMTKSYWVIGWGMTMFSLFFFYVVVYRLWQEGPESISIVVILMAIDVIFLVIGLFYLTAALFPIFMPNYRRILTWGETEEIAQQMYREFVLEDPLIRMDIGISTEHYLVLWMPYKRVFYWPMLAKCELSATGVYCLCFNDGSRCKLNHVYQQLIPPLRG